MAKINGESRNHVKHLKRIPIDRKLLFAILIIEVINVGLLLYKLL